MFDIGWSELFLIGIVSLMLISPKDLPKIIKSFKIFFANFNKVKQEFSKTIKDIEDEAMLLEMKEDFKVDFTKFSKEYIEPLEQQKEKIELEMKQQTLDKS